MSDLQPQAISPQPYVSQALFLGDNLQSSVGDGLVQLATLTLKIKQSAVTLISGTIKVITYVQAGQTHSIEEVAIDAGKGYVALEVSMSNPDPKPNLTP